MNGASRTALLCLLVAVQACAVDTAANSAPASTNPTAAESNAMDEHTIIVDAGAAVAVASTGLRIRLTEVQDSRCPVGVTCIWAGHASVTLLVERDGTSDETVVIGTEVPAGTDLPAAADVGPFRLELLALTPLPRAGETVAPGDYRAKVRIRRH